VWNVNETWGQVGRNGIKGLVQKGLRSVHRLIHNEKKFITILIFINANGETIPIFYMIKEIR